MRNQLKKHFFVMAALLGLLTGTSFAQKKSKYKRPAVETPPTFRGADTAPDATSIGNLKWFEIFSDEKLQGLIRIAVAGNYDLRQASARIDLERANLGLTRSNQFPQVAGGADVTTTRIPDNGVNTTAGQVKRTRSIGSVLLNLLSFEVDIWGRLRQQTKAAKSELQATVEDRNAAQTTIVSDVATGYFNLLELDSELEIAKRTLSARENSLSIIKIREQGGLATMLEVRQAEELVYQASQTIPDVEGRIEQTENFICLLIGQNPGPIERGRLLNDQPELPAVPPGLTSDLLDRRPDIRAAEQRLIESNALIKSAKAAYFPTISLTGLFGFQSNQLSSLFSGGGNTWSFAPQIVQPIFTAGRLKSNVRFEQARQKLTLAQYEQTIQTAFREVSDALIERRKVKEIRTQQEQLVLTLQDRSRLAYIRYEGGVDSLLNALDADRELFVAQLQLSQTRRNELLSLVQLYKALGGGWQP
jgi:NodT family efflux transporter outer membrane factor (OMF) lipoprotein